MVLVIFFDRFLSGLSGPVGSHVFEHLAVDQSVVCDSDTAAKSRPVFGDPIPPALGFPGHAGRYPGTVFLASLVLYHVITTGVSLSMLRVMFE